MRAGKVAEHQRVAPDEAARAHDGGAVVDEQEPAANCLGFSPCLADVPAIQDANEKVKQNQECDNHTLVALASFRFRAYSTCSGSATPTDAAIGRKYTPQVSSNAPLKPITLTTCPNQLVSIRYELQ